VVRAAALQPVKISARLKKHGVHVTEHRWVLYGETARIEIEMAEGLDLLLRPERTLVEKPRVDIELGDPAFDAAYLVQGDTVHALALLDADTRRLLLALHDRADVDLSAGSLAAALRLDRGATVDDVLPRLVKLVRRWSGGNPLHVRLIRNLRKDPSPSVRLNNLVCLLRMYAEHRDTRAALRFARRDASTEVRLLAAAALGSEGHPVLLDIAENAADDTCAARAIEALGRHLSREQATGILQRAIGAGRTSVACASIYWLGRHSGRESAATLIPLLELVAAAPAIAAATVLGDIGATAAEPALIAALSREPEVRLAAANALAHIGSAASVLPLCEAADRFSLDKDLGRATRQAIAEIQARLTGATPGQVSLAGDGAGQLSVAGDEAGRLSEPDPER
jgi:hypothetical protein